MVKSWLTIRRLSTFEGGCILRDITSHLAIPFVSGIDDNITGCFFLHRGRTSYFFYVFPVTLCDVKLHVIKRLIRYSPLLIRRWRAAKNLKTAVHSVARDLRSLSLSKGFITLPRLSVGWPETWHFNEPFLSFPQRLTFPHPNVAMYNWPHLCRVQERFWTGSLIAKKLI
jgi:hypothetical protein